jgi:hypothetical protein
VTPLSPTTTRTFEASPLDGPARFITGIFWVLVAGVWIGSGSLLSSGKTGIALVMAAVAVGLAAIAIACRLRQPMGYAVEEDGLTVVRRRGSRRIAGALRAAKPRPFHPRDLRLLGSGGLYGYLGRFRLADEGSVSSFVTDGRRGVLVDVGDRRVLVSPRDEAAFVRAAGGADA